MVSLFVGVIPQIRYVDIPILSLNYGSNIVHNSEPTAGHALFNLPLYDRSWNLICARRVQEGRFHGGIKFSPKELLNEVNLEYPKGKRLLTSLVLDTEGMPKIKKGFYDSSTIPEKIDPVDFDYDDDAMAEYYDSNPEISIIDIDVARADELLARRQEELEESLKEFDAQMESAEDEMKGEKIEMVRSPIEHNLEQVRALRTKLKKTK